MNIERITSAVIIGMGLIFAICLGIFLSGPSFEPPEFPYRPPTSKPSSSISGIILDISEKPVKDAIIMCRSQDGIKSITVSRPDGSFVLKHLNHGEYVIRAIKDQTAQEVVVKLDTQTMQLPEPVKLRPTFAIKVKTSVDQVSVILYKFFDFDSGNKPVELGKGITSSQGFQEFSAILNGSYQLMVRKEGYVSATKQFEVNDSDLTIDITLEKK